MYKTKRFNNIRVVSMATDNSSNISNMTYNRNTKTLTVLFKKGATYQYKDVDTKTLNKVLKAESVGKAMHEYIFKKFEYVRL